MVNYLVIVSGFFLIPEHQPVQRAMNERSRFIKEYPEIPTYLEYEAPNFKIYVGDFRSKLEGFKTYKQIGKEFRNAFIVPAHINLPKL